MKSLICTSLIGTIAAICLSSLTPASAEEALPSITVKFGDLNINNPAGAEVLYRRIQRAAERVCFYDDDAALPGLRRVCYLQAVADAVAKVKSAPLQALHGRKSSTAQS